MPELKPENAARAGTRGGRATMTVPVEPTAAPAAVSLLTGDDALGDLVAWRNAGLRTALVTLVGIEGTTPRPLGAQMAVAEDGRYSGYLSGGCIEQAVALEAVATITSRQNRLVRYGKGSVYFDLKLPCGSGLDLYFDQALDGDVLDGIAALRQERAAFGLVTDLGSGRSRIERLGYGMGTPSERRGDHFLRRCVPAPRVLLVGDGPALTAIARLIAATGLEIDTQSPDEASRAELAQAGLAVRGLADPGALDVSGADRWTAAVVAFHEHAWEGPALAELLSTACFYIGAMGSRTVHMSRLAELERMGFGGAALARIRSPIGLIPGAKSRLSLAVGILAEIVTEAKSAGLLA